MVWGDIFWHISAFPLVLVVFHSQIIDVSLHNQEGPAKRPFRNFYGAKNIPVVGQTLRPALMNIWTEVVVVLTR